MIIQRRKFLIGLAASALAAPAVIRSGILMPVKTVQPASMTITTVGWVDGPLKATTTYHLFAVPTVDGGWDTVVSTKPALEGYDLFYRIGAAKIDASALN